MDWLQTIFTEKYTAAHPKSENLKELMNFLSPRVEAFSK
jgi:hypothetical protein